jgi:hypothetical protein
MIQRESKLFRPLQRERLHLSVAKVLTKNINPLKETKHEVKRITKTEHEEIGV